MNRKIIFPLLAALFIIAGGALNAQIDYNSSDYGINPMDYSRVGTAGWQFLKLPANARSAAMGGVISAIGYGDARTAFTNPASASDVDNMDFMFNNMKWAADIQLNSFSAIRNFGQWGSFGLNFVYLDYGTMIRTENRQSYDEFGKDLGVMPVFNDLGTFGAHDMAVGLLYSRKINDQLQIGGNIRLLEEQLDDAKTQNWSFDIGTLYWTGLGSLRISMLGKNFGPDATFSSFDARIQRTPVKVRMPMMFVLGAAYDVLEITRDSPHRLMVAAEYVKPNDGTEKVNIGAEYFLMNYFYLRGGYKFNYDEEKYTFGIGMEYTVADEIKIKIDYAYADLGRFNHVNVLTLGLGL